LEVIRSALSSGHPMDAMRTAVSMLASSDPDAGDNGEDAELRKAARITATMPTLAAFYSRIRRGLEPIAPNPEFGHAENFLFMVTGDRPDAARAKAMNAAMTLMADHGLDASAFAARVVAGAGSDLHSAVTSAIATLKGPPDGGAATDVMGMILAVSDKSRANEALGEMLKTRRKIPGFGDRVYRGADPRAIQFKRICERLDGDAGDRGWFELTSHIEDIVNRRCGLSPNVDFYRAPAYHALGFPHDDFATVLTCSRAPGWIAHVIEQRADNRLLRPVEEYIGWLPRAFVPIDERV
jgi:citrate synthase